MNRLAVLAAGLVAVGAFNGGNVPSADPTEPEYEGMLSAQYDEFDRSKKARCLSTTLRTKQCWSDIDGSVFRYGCMPGDTRVFTDACSGGCEAEDCDGRWKWGGEQQQTCYDDGDHLYQFLCEAGEGAVNLPEVVLESTDSSGQAKSCAQLGWPLQPGDLSVCGYSKVHNGECAPPSDFASAESMCAAIGARLCTVAELAADETKGTGCKGDCASVWSADTCALEDGAAGHVSTAGAQKCLKKVPATCVADATAGVVRCCADDDFTGSASPAMQRFPLGFSAAISSDYKIADGSCGKAAPIAQYSCWTNPNSGDSMRFACSDNDKFIFHQSCGTDADCNPASCTGEWAKTGELQDQCYTRQEEGYLYHYTCPDKN